MQSQIVLINYADQKFKDAQMFCSKTGKYIGRCNKVISYHPDDIDTRFREENKNILDMERGAGLWLWKPYIIQKTLCQLRKGDYLFYCDSGAFFIRNIKPLIKSMDSDIWVTELPLIEEQWTKPSCFTKMGLEGSKYKKTNQIQASFLCIRKTDHSEMFVDEWLKLCCDYSLMKPETGRVEATETSSFIAHREDQSMLSLLCKKKGIKPHKDPSQFGRYPVGYSRPGYQFRVNCYPQDLYKPTIVLHRLPGIYKKSFLKSYIIAYGPKWLADKLFWRNRQ